MSEEGFFARWSRRKRAADAGLPVAEPQAPAEATPVGPARQAPAAPEEPPFDVTSLPPVESLTPESDVTAFLRKGVPAALQRAALRRAWSLDPAIRDFVGPADYAWDYNAVGGVPGFSLELTGDIKEMLARVLRPEPAQEAGGGAAPAIVDARTPEDGDGQGTPEQPAAVAAEVALPPPDATLAARPDAVRAAASDPAPSPVRRHGSALPS